MLAAGGSTRMGRPKALFPVGGVPLVRLHEAVLGTFCAEVRVVLGAYAAEIAGALGGAVPISNPAWAETGPRESLLLALEGLPDDARAFVTPVDVPPATRGALAHLEHTGAPAALGHGGEPGHPVLVDVGAARTILRRGGTLRDVLGPTPALVEAGPSVLLNLNTPGEWEAWAGAIPAHLPGFAGVDHVCPTCGGPVSTAELAALFDRVMPADEAVRLVRRFHRDADTLRIMWACGACVEAGRARLAPMDL